MNLADQKELMLRFSGCQFTFRHSQYDKADCVGVVRKVMADFAHVELPWPPTDENDWKDYLDILPWPVDELQEFDILFIAANNRHRLVDHVACHIGNDYIVHFPMQSFGVICERHHRIAHKILYIGRYKKQ